MTVTVEKMERRLDAIVAEALRRQRRQLDLAGVGKEERAARMVRVRTELTNWRQNAPAAVLRAAAESN